MRSAEIRKQIIKTGRDYSGSVFKSNLYDHDAPCAVCFVKSRGSMLMIPAQNDCPSGWTEEYYGYLMTAYYYHANQKDYLCVDKDQEYVHDTEQFGPEWRLAVPRGRELWLSSMSSQCSASRADMPCLHQVRISFPVG